MMTPPESVPRLSRGETIRQNSSHRLDGDVTLFSSERKEEHVTTSRTAEFVARLREPGADAAPEADDADEVTTRILAATRDLAEDVGLRRITMDDVARRSGLGRATVYRRFPNKAALIDTIVMTEARTYLEGDERAWALGDTLEDRMVHSTLFAVTFLREHKLLRKILRTEADAFLPSLTTEAGPILDFATAQSAAMLRTALYGDAPITAAQERHLRTAAELQTRLTLSFIVTPHTGIKLTSLDDLREYVRRYLLPMVVGPDGV
jgi:AcrR family transcriptional regulator